MRGSHEKNVGLGDWWENYWNGQVNYVKSQANNVNLAFIGDSITARWTGRENQGSWNKYFAQHKAINLGIGGDSTQHVLYRVQNGALDGYQARLFVLMIGTNNSHPEAEVALGIKAILDEIKNRQPQANLLLLGIFPRGVKPTSTDKNANVNKLIAKFEDDVVRYMDISQQFIEPDGTISKEVMPDELHLSPKGYEIWAQAIDAAVRELLVSPNASVLDSSINSGSGLGKVLQTLTQKMTSDNAAEAAEAKMMFEALRGGGQRNLDSLLTLKETQPLLAIPRLNRLATQFSGHDIGNMAKAEVEALRKDPRVKQEFKAEETLLKLKELEAGFRPVDGVRDPHSPAFRKLNLSGIESLIAGCQQLIKRHPGTNSAQKADAMMNAYR